MDRNRLARWCLIIALVFVFGWFGIDKFLNPILWIGFMPSWMDGLLGMSIDTWLVIVAVSEIAFAVLALVPVRNVRRVGVALMALHLVGVLWQVGWNDIAVRDIGLLLSSLALLALL